MADAKLTALTATTDIAAGDIIYVVRDPTTVPLSRKMEFSNLSLSLGMTPDDGWVPLTPTSDSWVPASTTDPYTITVPVGAESIYNKGDKLRFKQGAGYKYFYIYETTDALLSITGGADYLLTTDAITDVYYSKMENPLNFPDWLNWTTVHGGFSANPTYVARFKISGKTCHITYYTSALGTSNANNYSITLPVVAKTVAGFGWYDALGYCVDNTVAVASGLITIASGATVANLYKSAFVVWTTSGGKSATFVTNYEI